MKMKTYPESKEIMFLKADINYTEFHLVDGKKMMSSFSLLRHQEKLDGFLWVSKSHLLNPLFIAKVNTIGSAKEVQMRSGKRVKVSRRRKNETLLKVLNSK